MFLLTCFLLHDFRSALIQDPATLDLENTNLIDNTAAELTSEVETDFLVDDLNILQTKLSDESHGDEYNLNNGLDLSGNDTVKEMGNEDIDQQEHPSQTIDTQDKTKNEAEEDSAAPLPGKQCPDSLPACLAVCQPVLNIRILAFTLCERECWKRCGGRMEGFQ